MQYTDTIEKEAEDIFDMYAQQEEALNRYIDEYAGNPRPDDDFAEILYKLNEHLKHVNADLTRYVTNEH